MTRVRTRRHFSRLLLLFSSSEALRARHYLTLLLLGLTSVRTVLSDEKTRPQSRDLNALPRHAEVSRYSQRRDLAIPGAVPEWMQRKGNGPSSMSVGQSASGVVGDFHSADLRPDRRSRDSSAPPVTKRTHIDYEARTSASVLGDGRVAGRVRAPAARSKREFTYRSTADPLENQRAANGILSESMGRSRKSAKDKLDDLLGERTGVSALRVTRRHSMVPAAEREAQFQDETSFTVFGEGRQSTGDFPKDSVHDPGAQGASIEAPIDQPRSSEPWSISHIARLTTSRRDGEEDSFEWVKQTALNTAGRSINRDKRTSDYPTRREARSNKAKPSARDIDFAAKRRSDLAGNRSDRGIAARQARSDTYALNNRSDATRRGSNSDYLNFDFATDDSPNWRAKDGNVVIASGTEGDIAPMENRVEVSEIGNRTGSNSQQFGTDCTTLVIRERKLSGVTESSEDRFARMRDASTTPDNDVDIVETPFTGFQGSQKFPAKINRDKSASMVPQVKKFDWRHFSPHKENVLEESNLPSSAGRDALHRLRETSAGTVADVEMDGESGDEEILLQEDQKWNDTRDELRLPGTSSDRSSPADLSKSRPDEGFAVTVTANGDIEVASYGGNDPDGIAAIDVTMPSVKSIEKTNITILGLFEMTNATMPRPEGSSELQAAKLAVERVNESDILGRFRLRLIYNDTKVSRPISGVNVRAMDETRCCIPNDQPFSSRSAGCFPFFLLFFCFFYEILLIKHNAAKVAWKSCFNREK